MGKRWRAAGISESDPQATIMIPDCIDYAIFYLLDAIDNGELHVQLTADDGSTVDLTTEGGGAMAGWYVGPRDDWRARYSAQRRASFMEDD